MPVSNEAFLVTLDAKDAKIAMLKSVIKSLLSEVIEYTDHDGAEAEGCAACAAVNRARAALQPST